MYLHLVSNRKVSIALAGALLTASLTAAAHAAVRPPVKPADTEEWGNGIIRVTSTDPGTVAVGPSGAMMANTPGGGGSDTSSLSRRLSRMRPADTAPTADYCVELDLTDDSSGPYRVQLYLDSGSGDSMSAVRRPHGARHLVARRNASTQDTTLSLTFDLDTTADGTVSTTGDVGLVGAIYDASDDLVASDDDSGDRISASLASGSYTLVIQGGDQLADDYVVTADQGTCGDD